MASHVISDDSDYNEDDEEDNFRAKLLSPENGDNDSVLLRRCFREQISELSLLKSMYNIPNELQFTAVEDFEQRTIDELLTFDDQEGDIGDHDRILSMRHLWSEFVIKIRDIKTETPIELTISFPVRYPFYAPLIIYVRSSNLNGSESCRLNSAIRNYLTKNVQKDEPRRVTDVIAWIFDNFDEFNKLNYHSLSSADSASPVQKLIQQQRLWIYSHHIYSKTKRKNILSLSDELALTGFSMPGKPGIICVEGAEENCRQFWETLRTWTWKKLVIKHEQSSSTDDKTTALSADELGFRKFGALKEVGFDARHGGGREFHMDMGGFHKFLVEHKCGELFSILFGIEPVVESTTVKQQQQHLP